MTLKDVFSSLDLSQGSSSPSHLGSPLSGCVGPWVKDQIQSTKACEGSCCEADCDFFFFLSKKENIYQGDRYMPRYGKSMNFTTKLEEACGTINFVGNGTIFRLPLKAYWRTRSPTLCNPGYYLAYAVSWQQKCETAWEIDKNWHQTWWLCFDIGIKVLTLEPKS